MVLLGVAIMFFALDRTTMALTFDNVRLIKFAAQSTYTKLKESCQDLDGVDLYYHCYRTKKADLQLRTGTSIFFQTLLSMRLLQEISSVAPKGQKNSQVDFSRTLFLLNASMVEVSEGLTGICERDPVNSLEEKYFSSYKQELASTFSFMKNTFSKHTAKSNLDFKSWNQRFSEYEKNISESCGSEIFQIKSSRSTASLAAE